MKFSGFTFAEVLPVLHKSHIESVIAKEKLQQQIWNFKKQKNFSEAQIDLNHLIYQIIHEKSKNIKCNNKNLNKNVEHRRFISLRSLSMAFQLQIRKWINIQQRAFCIYKISNLLDFINLKIRKRKDDALMV